MKSYSFYVMFEGEITVGATVIFNFSIDKQNRDLSYIGAFYYAYKKLPIIELVIPNYLLKFEYFNLLNSLLNNVTENNFKQILLKIKNKQSFEDCLYHEFLHYWKSLKFNEVEDYLKVATVTSNTQNDQFEYLSYTNQLFRHIVNIAKNNGFVLNTFDDVLRIYNNINENDKFYFDMINKIKLNFKDSNLEETLKNIFEERKSLNMLNESNKTFDEVFQKHFPKEYEKLINTPQEVFDKIYEEKIKFLEKKLGGKVEFDHWIEFPDSYL